MSALNLRMPDGSWQPVGDAGHPLNLRMPDGSWEAFGGGGGGPLSLRMPDGSWLAVTTAGIGGSISGTVTRANGEDPAANRTVTAVGPTTRATTTDSNGNYVFPSLELGTYTITVYTVDISVGSQVLTATTTLAANHLSAIINFTITAGSQLITVQFGGDSGWFASQGTGDDVFIQGIPANTLSANSEKMNEFFAFGTRTVDSVTWLPLPIQAMRSWADAQVVTLPYPELESITVSFRITGSSYLWDGVNEVVDYDDGIGTIVYQGPAGTDTVAEIAWAPEQNTVRTDVMPVVRDRELARESGVTTVWQDHLKFGNVPGQSRTAIHLLPPDYADAAALYHANTSQAPAPEDAPGDLLISMNTDIVVIFTYQTG